MNFRNPLLLLSLTLSFFYLSCQTKTEVPQAGEALSAKAQLVSNKDFDDYWYAGEAELTSYDLQQARYGEIHQGEAVLVFVTEPFSLSKGVKLDQPGQNPKDAVSVMKLNLTKKFYTGIYPYSMMQSSFTPVDLKKHPHTIKVSTSSQEWCGHTFTQLSLKKSGYHLQEHSYFENEGEIDKNLELVLLEDEIWNRIRINPAELPLGQVKIIPGTFYSRLRHRPLATEQASATLSDAEGHSDWLTYSLDYPELKRTLRIHFSKTFPHEIQGWDDSYTSGWGPGEKRLTTTATRKKSLKLDYWTRHNVADAKYRELLGLEEK